MGENIIGAPSYNHGHKKEQDKAYRDRLHGRKLQTPLRQQSSKRNNADRSRGVPERTLRAEQGGVARGANLCMNQAAFRRELQLCKYPPREPSSRSGRNLPRTGGIAWRSLVFALAEESSYVTKA